MEYIDIFDENEKYYYDTEYCKISMSVHLNGRRKENYISATTFIKIYEAFIKNKKIYLYSDIQEECFMMKYQDFLQ